MLNRPSQIRHVKTEFLTQEVRIANKSSETEPEAAKSRIPPPTHAERLDHELSRQAFLAGGRGV